MQAQFGIRVYKQYFNFSASHFLIFKNGEREPLHGHNYRVEVRGDGQQLTADLVFDFLHLKPIVRDICQEFDHRLILPRDNEFLRIDSREEHYYVSTLDPQAGSFVFPKKDVVILPLPNTSAERLAIYITQRIQTEVWKRFQFSFHSLEVEVEETPGQSAVYRFQNEWEGLTAPPDSL